ncbi:hypothetical protein [Microbacterium marinilacus]|uniref:Secreted protein n=1 Tax=Microbacterium marinilacus TaxID=415209 RepID=A0ABP7BM78_9MICO|nr:hypothetical protein [Microbacterium marinilacus]MBY0688426.1 hypothetical protein [Microbacterium marinilacus]
MNKPNITRVGATAVFLALLVATWVLRMQGALSDVAAGVITLVLIAAAVTVGVLLSRKNRPEAGSTSGQPVTTREPDLTTK